MKIDRHNYEEYFILYLDNELDAPARRMVESFVALHPDLKEELDLLSQFKMVPDTTIVFEGKEEMFKVDGETVVSLTNYEEWMILYLDKELDASQQLVFEQFMLTHPLLQEQFHQLKKARLEPEIVLFPGKASLYRKEEKERRFPAWWRLAAAAVLLIAVSITTFTVLSKNGQVKNDEIASDNIPVLKTGAKTPVINTPTPNTQNVALNNEGPSNIIPVEQRTREKDIVVKQLTTLKKEKANTVVLPELVKEDPVVVIQKSNDLPRPLNNAAVVKNNSEHTAIANQAPAEIPDQKIALTNHNVTSTDAVSSDIMNASYDESEKKNKNRGIFRKIARTFEKRTSIDVTDDNRLLVAGLAIKLK